MSYSAQLVEIFAYVFGALCVLVGAGAVITEWVLRYRRQQRRNKRLFGHGFIYSTKDTHE